MSIINTCPTGAVNPDVLNTGQVKPNNSPLNPAPSKIIIQVKTSYEVISIILIHLYLQNKPAQNCKNMESWTKLSSSNTYWCNLVQAHWSLYLDGRNTSKFII